MEPLRQLGLPCRAIPFFIGLGRNLALDQQLGKLPALRFALDWHKSPRSACKTATHRQTIVNHASGRNGRSALHVPLVCATYGQTGSPMPVSYTHLRAHETP